MNYFLPIPTFGSINSLNTGFWDFTDIFFFLIDRYVEKGALKALVIVGLSFLGNVSVMLFANNLPFALSASLVGLGLYYMGYLMKTYYEEAVLSKLLNLTWLEIIMGGV